MSRIILRSIISILVFGSSVYSTAQASGSQLDDQGALDASQRELVVNSAADLLQSHYIFPEIGTDCAKFITSRLFDGAYDEITNAFEFADSLTADLRSISNDGHMNVNLHPAEADDEMDPAKRELERQRQSVASKRDNFAFRRLEWLPGNVMFLELRSFRHTDEAGPAAVAAMNLIAHADAVIIDLRSNRGGHPTMIQLISSYFFDGPTHLNSFQVRDKEQIDQFWTLPHVPGPKLVDKPLFVLIGGYTYSAAEEFAYNLKALNRATLVGNQTGGGAHPTRSYKIDEDFAISIPFARAINPVTGTNWEGVSVEPDIEVHPEGFMAGRTIAHLQALKVIELTIEDDGYRQSIRLLIDELQTEVDSFPAR